MGGVKHKERSKDWDGTMTLLRGASWNNDNPQNARAAYRNHNNNPRNRNDNNGARLARGPIRPVGGSRPHLLPSRWVGQSSAAPWTAGSCEMSPGSVPVFAIRRVVHP